MARTLCVAALALIQISFVSSLATQPKRQTDKDLPEVSEVQRGPRQVATKLTSKLQLFEAKLAAAQKKSTNQLQAKKAKYEKVLKAEVAGIEELRSNNTKLLEDIDAVRNVNAQQRRHADELKAAATNLRAELQHMQSNITFVQQLMDESLTSSEESMKAKPLNVLTELQDLEHKENEQKARKLRLLAITKHKKTKSVMLQFPVSHLSDKAQELLSTMSTGLDEYYGDQHEALATMEQSFLKEQAALNATRGELLKEKSELDSIKATENDLDKRLKAAVKILEKATEHLTQKVNAVRGFTKRMGQKAMPVALLQDDAVRQPKDTLPKVWQVLNKTTETLNHMHSDTISLAARVHQTQKEASHKLAQQKAIYEKDLKEQDAQNLAVKQENSGISKEIKFLRKQNAGFRSQAQEMDEENHRFRSKLHLLQMNISTAEEFTNDALADADARLNVSNSADLQVLAELDAEDVGRAKKAAKEKEFSIVSESVSSLLELKSSRSAEHGKPQELLQSLMSSLESLSGVEDESLAELKTTFEGQWQAGEKEHVDLLEQQMVLNSTWANESDVNLRLRKAVSHLSKSNEELKKKTASVGSFVGNLATGDHKTDIEMMRLKQRSKHASHSHSPAHASSQAKNHKRVSLLQEDLLDRRFGWEEEDSELAAVVAGKAQADAELAAEGKAQAEAEAAARVEAEGEAEELQDAEDELNTRDAGPKAVQKQIAAAQLKNCSQLAAIGNLPDGRLVMNAQALKKRFGGLEVDEILEGEMVYIRHNKDCPERAEYVLDPLVG